MEDRYHVSLSYDRGFLYAIGGLHLRDLTAEITKVPCDREQLLAETRDWTLAQLSFSAQT